MKIGNAKTGDTISDLGNTLVIEQAGYICLVDLHQYSRAQVQHLIDQMQKINDKSRVNKSGDKE